MYETMLNGNDDNNNRNHKHNASNNVLRKSNTNNESGMPYLDDEPHNPNYISDLNNIPKEKRSLFEN